jgi:UDP-GlcNAc:undecaprenyl-phosphate GlcNAc-1-phosphate transferase
MMALGEVSTVRSSGVALVLAAASSMLFTYLVRRRARRAGLFDPTDDRKTHEMAIPRVGGVAIVLSVATTLALLTWYAGGGVLTDSGTGLLVVLAGGLATHLLGLYDDLWQVRARWKFLSQLAIAAAVYGFGVRVTTLSLPFFGIVHLAPVVALVFTVLWLVGITNAFNLIDGLDGLASGAALFALTTMFVVASANGRGGAALVTIVLAGATAGFLYYNFHPATIFLGDSGSLFLGFMLAGIGLLSAEKGTTVVAVAIPVVSLGFPVLDTALAIVRRFLRGQPIFAADRGHIHHRLLGRGYSPRTVVLALYAACAVLAMSGMLLVNDGAHVVVVLTLVGLGVLLAVQRLRIVEFEEVARLVRRGTARWDTVARNVRVREASARLAAMGNLGEVFRTLEQTFADDGCPRVEIRLCTTFLRDARPADGVAVDDDVSVWVWSRELHPASEWWHVSLPLTDPTGARLGSLVIWQDADTARGPVLPNFPTIAGELRVHLASKLLTLWHSVPARQIPSLGARVGDRLDRHAERQGEWVTDLSADRAGERVIERVQSGHGPRVA